MKKSKGMQLGSLLAVMLLLSMAFVPAVSAKNELNTIQKPSEFEQGIIDALNSNEERTSIDDVILNYAKLNSDKAKLKDNNNIKKDPSFINNTNRTYELKNGMKIIFTDRGFFYVTEIKEEKNTHIQSFGTQSLSNIPAIGIQSMNYTPTITATWSAYASFSGLKVYTLYTKGYFGYDGSSVEAHHVDSWYVRGSPTVWQVSNWEEGGYNHADGTQAQFYGRGNFHWGLEYQGIGLVIDDWYTNLYVEGDENGNYQAYITETEG